MSYTKQRGGIILVGDLASRPAASVGEYWYFATDEDGGTLYHSDGSSWTAITAGISGGAGVTFGTPAVALGTSAAAGSIDEAIRRDSTIVAFDATVPTTQAFGDSAATGSAAVAARRDHKHAMPAAPTSVSGNAGTATALQTGRTIDGQTFDGTANITVIAPGTHAASSKTTPVDNDEIPLVDSAASNVLKKVLWSNVKATLKTYFDTLYSASGTPAGSIEYDYVEITSNVTVSGSEGSPTSVITGNSVSYDGSTRIKIEFYSPLLSNAGPSTAVVLSLWDGSTDLGRLALNEATAQDLPCYVARFLTPSNASHAYHIKGWKVTTNGTVFAGAGGAGVYVPAFMRITKA